MKWDRWVGRLTAATAVISISLLGALSGVAGASWDFTCSAGEVCVYKTGPSSPIAANETSDNHYDGDVFSDQSALNNNVDYVNNEGTSGCGVRIYQHGNYNQYQAGWSEWYSYLDGSGHYLQNAHKNQASSHSWCA